MKRIFKILTGILLLGFVFVTGTGQAAATGTTGFQVTEYGVQQNADGSFYFQTYYSRPSNTLEYFSFAVSGEELKVDSSVTFESSDPSVCSIDASDATRTIPPYYNDTYKMGVPVKINQPGTAVITARVAGKEYPLTVIAAPSMCAEITSIAVNDYHSVRVNWNKISAATGYLVVRADLSGKTGDTVPLTIVSEVNDANMLSAVVSAPKEVSYAYAVYPKMKVGEKEYYSIPEKYYTYYMANIKGYMKYTLDYQHKNDLTSVTSAGNQITLNWVTDPLVSSYEIYEKRLTGAWKQIHTVTSADAGSYTLTEKEGNAYAFRIVYVYPDDRLQTNEKSCYLLKNSRKMVRKINIKQRLNYGQYDGGNWPSTEETFYYEKSGKLHVVCYTDRKLIDYTTDGNGKITSKKTVKLGAMEYFGGFYYAPDGNYYVAVGYGNEKKSKTKTVIKVYQYSSNWKRKKTCKIKGKVGNVFPGIVVPFDAGSCRMEYCEDSLYLFTSRLMFSGHQSNISFRINPSDMTYQMANEDYTSHSFNQYVRYDNNTLYLSNHGDAYSRGVNLTTVTAYGTKKQQVKSRLPFKIKGKSGNNYTGLTEGGMEVTKDHVLIAGTSVPQNYKVAGVKGNSYRYAQNVYVIVCDKNSEKSKVQWITTYHPKKTKVIVDEVRLVKLSDDYVALLYTTTLKKKTTLHYVVLNESGSVVYKTTYKGMKFSASTQPVLYDGAIVWTDVVEKYKKKTYEYTEQPYYYQIPAKIG